MNGILKNMRLQRRKLKFLRRKYGGVAHLGARVYHEPHQKIRQDAQTTSRFIGDNLRQASEWH